MSENELFSKTLKLSGPWFIERSSFEEEAKQLDLYINFKDDMKFSCMKCNSENLDVMDINHASWQYYNFFDNKTYVHARVPNVKCPNCGVLEIQVPWDRRKKDRRAIANRRFNPEREITDRRKKQERRGAKKIYP
ncbi:transposase family protein [Spirochaetota bacterium]